MQEEEHVHVQSSCDQQAHETSPSTACAVRRPWDLLEQLIALGLQPDRYTCSTLVKGMHLAGCSSEEIDQAMKLLRLVGPQALEESSAERRTGNTRLLEVVFNTLLDACVSIH